MCVVDGVASLHAQDPTCAGENWATRDYDLGKRTWYQQISSRKLSHILLKKTQL